ncbi:MAG: hypothetical protein A2Y03_09070 [Omnitrophica WOR_2 bacterium GWF2_38_59]|nr:MAG: hypothetical protein A2Y06_02755 [Omnitrophica WOR_2 bacterium GWA2_37_7]OGX26255.1 MAG: hypothetical protein A2Y03_09070 [Omnitrophica WOR_2 bacterium GWF2_38_59]OGX47986.1 MAG: hypothetical protein A2243_01440 [Omnitrophica WOR_2 bacterium RIFOXYA2_FULL_38_17]OGX53346.1 MAG: hypothetical protein A2267_00855 [Omnitrophica WOR_2 bacterium RIFOXYA12_FULL_38_10]OGX55915.1 MAG: hypothetical protein A2306_09070 [Omnitrophica WOR_2 bacterium RIFOXYB2_FULL_38_16]OGX56322.1 MAG: hypothetical 
MQYYSIPQMAEKLNVSRIAIYKKVKNGSIKAVRIGKNYAIISDEIPNITVRNKKRMGPKKQTVIKPDRANKKPLILEQEKQDLCESIKAMKPEQRLIAYYNHNFNINAMYIAGAAQRKRTK